MSIPHFHRMLLITLVIAIGCNPLDFGSDTESKGLTYKRYIARVGDTWFDPVGASDINYRCLTSRDGFDVWWRFTVSQSDAERLAVTVARDNNAPVNIEWSETCDPPESWRPDGSAPLWWNPASAEHSQSMHWCYDAGTAERHHGWYFLYNAQSQTMHCWHWNHQWSSSECTESAAR